MFSTIFWDSCLTMKINITIYFSSDNPQCTLNNKIVCTVLSNTFFISLLWGYFFLSLYFMKLLGLLVQSYKEHFWICAFYLELHFLMFLQLYLIISLWKMSMQCKRDTRLCKNELGKILKMLQISAFCSAARCVMKKKWAQIHKVKWFWVLF